MLVISWQNFRNVMKCPRTGLLVHTRWHKLPALTCSTFSQKLTIKIIFRFMNISSAPPEALTFNLESVSNLFHNALKTPIAAVFLDVDQFSAESSKDQFVISLFMAVALTCTVSYYNNICCKKKMTRTLKIWIKMFSDSVHVPWDQRSRN